MKTSPRHAADPLPEPDGRTYSSWDEFSDYDDPIDDWGATPTEAVAEESWPWERDDEVAGDYWSSSTGPLAAAAPMASDSAARRPQGRPDPRAQEDTAPMPVPEFARRPAPRTHTQTPSWDVPTEAYSVNPEGSPRPEAEPTRAHGTLPPPAPRKDALRRWGRTSILIVSLALLGSAGAVMLPRAFNSLTAEPAPRSDQPGIASPTPAPTDDGPTRAMERPSREVESPTGTRIANSAAPTPEPERSASPAAPVAVRMAPIPTVAGIPEPCPTDVRITEAMSAREIAERTESQWGFQLTGPQWRQASYRPVVKLFAETLDSVDCTDFLNRVKSGNGGRLEVSSMPTNSWAWGDYGLTRPNVLTLDFAKFSQGYAEGQRGRLVRLIIHEMAHSLNADRFGEPAYWKRFDSVWTSTGPVSAYGDTPTESFADAVGYYVARCAQDNPYANRDKAAYYTYVKDNVFGGREFGSAVGTPQDCAVKGT